ncbi:MAG: hypothetical protein U0T78_07645 [Cloacibacterium normanense]
MLKTTTLANKKVIDNYFKNGMIQKTEVLYIDVRVKKLKIKSLMQNLT